MTNAALVISTPSEASAPARSARVLSGAASASITAAEARSIVAESSPCPDRSWSSVLRRTLGAVSSTSQATSSAVT